MSKMTVVGNLTGDPELRFTPSGAAVVNFTVAENHRKKDAQTGEWSDDGSTFYRVTAWRGLAENVAESLTKGCRVIVSGEFRTREFERKGERAGEKGMSVEINADNIGPDLAYATAKVIRTQRSNGGGQSNSGGAGGGQGGGQSAPANDPWSSAASSDEPPF